MRPSYNQARLDDFARQYGFHYDLYDPRSLIEDFKQQMRQGLEGRESSLAMIPSYLRPVPQKWAGSRVIALDAGGTNLRAALVSFDGQGKIQTGEVRKVPMPGSQGRLDADAFFDEIAAQVIPLLENDRKIDSIGFCFSYPMEITGDADGILTSFSKEVDAPDVVGRKIGASLLDAIKRKGRVAPGRVVLLNDTAAALLAGMAELPNGLTVGGLTAGGLTAGGLTAGKPPAGSVIGFILGTGINIAYPEKTIPKIGFNSGTVPMVLVMECGNFAYHQQGLLDLGYDQTTRNPGRYTLEKAAAGAYLGPLCLFIFKQAVNDGVLCFRRQAQLLEMPNLETRGLNCFLNNPLDGKEPPGSLFDDDEIDARRTIFRLSSIVTERAARLSAAMLAATVEWMSCMENPDPLSPVRIAVEGTTYLRYRGMRAALDSYLYTMLGNAVCYEITPVEQASLSGAAVAAVLS